MADNDEVGGSVYRGGRTINREDAWDLVRYGLLAPPACRLPKGWCVSAGGLPVPPLPATAMQIRRVIARRHGWMSQRERASRER